MVSGYSIIRPSIRVPPREGCRLGAESYPGAAAAGPGGARFPGLRNTFPDSGVSGGRRTIMDEPRTNLHRSGWLPFVAVAALALLGAGGYGAWRLWGSRGDPPAPGVLGSAPEPPPAG